MKAESIITRILIIFVALELIVGITLGIIKDSHFKKEARETRLGMLENKYNFVINNYSQNINEYLNPTEKWNEEQANKIEAFAFNNATFLITKSWVTDGYKSVLLDVIRKKFRNNPDSVINLVCSQFGDYKIPNSVISHLNENEAEVLNNTLLLEDK